MGALRAAEASREGQKLTALRYSATNPHDHRAGLRRRYFEADGAKGIRRATLPGFDVATRIKGGSGGGRPCRCKGARVLTELERSGSAVAGWADEDYARLLAGFRSPCESRAR